MRLTQFSNFALRSLMYAALNHEQPSAVNDMARAYGISPNHLKKAVQELTRLGYLETVRGRKGGVRLAVAPQTLTVGEVIRHTEGNMTLVECFDPAVNTCPIAGTCRLSGALHEALEAFLAVLDKYSIADLIVDEGTLSRLLDLQPAEAGTAATQ